VVHFSHIRRSLMRRPEGRRRPALAAILAGSPLLNQGAPRLHRSAGLNGGHEWEGVASEAERYLLSLPLRPGIAPIRSERGTSLRA
jgi:hypothetical protein